MKKFSIVFLFLTVCFSAHSQYGSNPAEWMNECINWTTKTEEDVLRLQVEKVYEVDLRPNGLRLLKQYLLRVNNSIAIIFSSWDGKIDMVEFQVDYTEKTKFEQDAEMVRQMVYAYNCRVKSERMGSMFNYSIPMPDARSIIYEANLENIFELSMTVDSDYPSKKWSGFIWIYAHRKK
jgi:hypothetical protein